MYYWKLWADGKEYTIEPLLGNRWHLAVYDLKTKMLLSDKITIENEQLEFVMTNIAEKTGGNWVKELTDAGKEKEKFLESIDDYK